MRLCCFTNSQVGSWVLLVVLFYLLELPLRKTFQDGLSFL